MTRLEKEMKKWVVNYDEDEDTLYIGRPKMPRDSVLYQINDGYACHLTLRGKIVGISIEYFRWETLKIKKKMKIN